MLDKKYLSNIRGEMKNYALKRRDIIKEAGDALHHAKRAVFAVHRGHSAEAKEKLETAEAMLHAIEQRHKKEPLLLEEGAYRAAVEEYVEAYLFYNFILSQKIVQVKTIRANPELYLAGLCDVPGELYRYAIRAATAHDTSTVKLCAEASAEIIGELIEFDLTSYLRTKFDQAKQANHKLEEVVYEVALKSTVS